MSKRQKIDMARCIRASFYDAENLTLEQLALAHDLIVDGPPANGKHIVLKLAGGAKWYPDTNTITRGNATLRVLANRQDIAWSFSHPNQGQPGNGNQ